MNLEQIEAEIELLKSQVRKLEVSLDLYRAGSNRVLDECHAIASMVAAEYQVPLRSLFGKTRPEPVAQARQLAMALLRERGHKLESIGEYFGGRIHGTVMHAVTAVNRREGWPIEGERIKRIREQVNSALPIPTSASNAKPSSVAFSVLSYEPKAAD